MSRLIWNSNTKVGGRPAYIVTNVEGVRYLVSKKKSQTMDIEYPICSRGVNNYGNYWVIFECEPDKIYYYRYFDDCNGYSGLLSIEYIT